MHDADPKNINNNTMFLFDDRHIVMFFFGRICDVYLSFPNNEFLFYIVLTVGN